MNALRSSSYIFALLITAGGAAIGCGSDNNDNNNPANGDGDAGGGDGDGAVPPSYELTGTVAPVPGTAPANQCQEGVDHRASGMCYGFFCGTNSNSIKAGLTPGAVCGSDPEVWIACDGEATRTVATCARENATMPDFNASTKACARRNTKLDVVDDACLDCYIASALCARDKCLVECLSGDSVECDTCREDQGCTPGYYTCGGLPDPQ
ncbi:MAG: hypothetical protein QM778_12835 [Myxococcales bacterium]